MADNTNHQDDLEYIQELLSPYLDGAVTDEERALVEQALATSPDLRLEFESLRQTVAMVKALPPVPAPRPFTLSEADVASAAPASKRSFWLPKWAGGLALLATALVCVLVAGGVFFSTQFGQGALAPAEVARFQEDVASQAVETEADQAAAEPAAEAITEELDEAKQETTEGALAVEETELEQEATPEEPVEPTDSLSEGTKIVTEAEAESGGVTGDDTTSFAGQPEVAENQEAAQRDSDRTLSKAGELGSGAPQPTAPLTLQPAATASPPPLPSPTTTPPTELAAEAAVEEALGGAEQAAPAQAAPAAEPSAEEVEAESMADTEGPVAVQPPLPSVSESPDQQSLTYRRENARQVEIQNRRLQIQPGLIQIDGLIDVPPGTILVATILRDEVPFDEWADPASLQSVVQPDGRFTFIIRSRAGRTDADLFALEPANYQIVIVSMGEDMPVAAAVFFAPPSTPSPPPTAAPPTSRPSPTPNRTATAQPAVVSQVSPTVQVSPTSVVETTSPSPLDLGSRNVLPGLILTAIIILLLVGVVLVGVVVWFNLNKKP